MPRNVSMPGDPSEEPAKNEQMSFGSFGEEEKLKEQIGIPKSEPEPQPEYEEADAQSEDPFADTANIQVEDLDPNTQIWPEGPTAGQVVHWKEEFGAIYLTSITFDKHVVWRAMDRKEYKGLVRQMEQLRDQGRMSPIELNMTQEELITRMCVIFPSYKNADFDQDLAGLPSIISQQVLESSGFQAVDVREL